MVKGLRTTALRIVGLWEDVLGLLKIAMFSYALLLRDKISPGCGKILIKIHVYFKALGFYWNKIALLLLAAI